MTLAITMGDASGVGPEILLRRWCMEGGLGGDVVVYGDAKRYLVAGVWLNDAAAQHDGRLEARMAEVNARLAKHETLKKWQVMPRPLTVEGGLLTPTLKVKRKAVYEAFRSEFEGMYA